MIMILAIVSNFFKMETLYYYTKYETFQQHLVLTTNAYILNRKKISFKVTNKNNT